MLFWEIREKCRWLVGSRRLEAPRPALKNTSRDNSDDEVEKLLGLKAFGCK